MRHSEILSPTWSMGLPCEYAAGQVINAYKFVESPITPTCFNGEFNCGLTFEFNLEKLIEEDIDASVGTGLATFAYRDDQLLDFKIVEFQINCVRQLLMFTWTCRRNWERIEQYKVQLDELKLVVSYDVKTKRRRGIDDAWL